MPPLTRVCRVVIALSTAACSTGLGSPVAQPTSPPAAMETITPREIGDANQGLRPGECRLYTYQPGCRAPLDGINAPIMGGPGEVAGQFVTLPATTTRTRDGAVMVKAAVGSSVINDQYAESVIGQLLVHMKPVAHAFMTTTWHYRGGTGRCSARGNQDGVAACVRPSLTLGAHDGDTIVIEVTFNYRGHSYSSHASFQPSSD